MLLRLLVDALILTGLGLLCLGYVAYEHGLEVEQGDIRLLRDNVRQIEQQVKLQAALGRTPCNEDGFPMTVDPAWFGTSIPRNPLLNDGRHPWIEVAHGGELEADHPRVPVATTNAMAGFWYNPRTGVVRARVPQLVSDERTLQTYNFVNSSNLKRLFAHDIESMTGSKTNSQ